MCQASAESAAHVSTSSTASRMRGVGDPTPAGVGSARGAPEAGAPARLAGSAAAVSEETEVVAAPTAELLEGNVEAPTPEVREGDVVAAAAAEAAEDPETEVAVRVAAPSLGSLPVEGGRERPTPSGTWGREGTHPLEEAAAARDSRRKARGPRGPPFSSKNNALRSRGAAPPRKI